MLEGLCDLSLNVLRFPLKLHPAHPPSGIRPVGGSSQLMPDWYLLLVLPPCENGWKIVCLKAYILILILHITMFTTDYLPLQFIFPCC